MSRSSSKRRARERGRLAWRVLVGVTIGMLVLRLVWLVVAAFLDDPQPLPAWPWVVAALVAPAALVVFWRPSQRVPNCLAHTAFAAVLLGIGGLESGSPVPAVIAGATIVGVLLASRQHSRPGRAEPATR